MTDDLPQDGPLQQFDNDALVRAARRGIEVDAALHTPIGRLVMERAIDDAHDALVALIQIDPTKADQIRVLQNRVTRAADICRWLQEAIDEGLMAEKQIREEDGLVDDPAYGAERPE